MQEAELRRTEQVQINGAMQRQQNAIRSSQQISRTLSETSDIVNQAYWDRSERMDACGRKIPRRSAVSIPTPIPPGGSTRRMLRMTTSTVAGMIHLPEVKTGVSISARSGRN